MAVTTLIWLTPRPTELNAADGCRVEVVTELVPVSDE